MHIDIHCCYFLLLFICWFLFVCNQSAVAIGNREWERKTWALIGNWASRGQGFALVNTKNDSKYNAPKIVYPCRHLHPNFDVWQVYDIVVRIHQKGCMKLHTICEIGW